MVSAQRTSGSCRRVPADFGRTTLVRLVTWAARDDGTWRAGLRAGDRQNISDIGLGMLINTRTDSGQRVRVQMPLPGAITPDPHGQNKRATQDNDNELPVHFRDPEHNGVEQTLFFSRQA